MSGASSQRSAALAELGFEHGFGVRPGHEAAIAALTQVRQVHGTRLLRVPLARADAEADALWTSVPGLAVGVHTADCVPILLADRDRRGVAVVHAGWRGSAAGVAGRAALEFANGIAIAPEDLLAVIGPHIGPCCYEVDDPVREAVADTSVFRDAPRRPGHYMLDLFALNLTQLVAAGVAPERVYREGGCSCCATARYPSYRRDGTGARMVHWIRMPAA